MRAPSALTWVNLRMTLGPDADATPWAAGCCGANTSSALSAQSYPQCMPLQYRPRRLSKACAGPRKASLFRSHHRGPRIHRESFRLGTARTASEARTQTAGTSIVLIASEAMLERRQRYHAFRRHRKASVGLLCYNQSWTPPCVLMPRLRLDSCSFSYLSPSVSHSAPAAIWGSQVMRGNVQI